MKVCNEIKRRIDEADDVESFDFDIARHTAVCDDCRRFAGERAALKALIVSTARVNAPLNFEAMLQARLAEVKAHKPLAWLNAAFYLRAGALLVSLLALGHISLAILEEPIHQPGQLVCRGRGRFGRAQPALEPSEPGPQGTLGVVQRSRRQPATSRNCRMFRRQLHQPLMTARELRRRPFILSQQPLPSMAL